MNILHCGLRGPARQLAFGQIRTLSFLRPNVLTSLLRASNLGIHQQRQLTLSGLKEKWGVFRSAATLSPQQVANVANAEAEANAHPTDVTKQIVLFQTLSSTNMKPGWELIITRWERLCQFDPTSPLLRSDALFQLYLTSLKNTGMTDSISPAVRRRESILATPIPVEETIAETSLTENVPATEAPAIPAVPKSKSEEIAAQVLAGAAESHPDITKATAGRPTTDAAGLLSGSSSEPIHVIVNEPKGSWAMKLARFAIGAGLCFAFAMVVLAVFFENSGLMKGSKKSMYTPADGKEVMFSDVHGVDEVKEELLDIVEFLKDPAAFATLGGKLPKGCLLTGPPGTGKTLLARAVAGEAGVPFFVASGSEFEEMFVGVGAKRVRELFAAARKQQPAIIFIDELDAIGSKRTGKEQYARQTLNQLLTEMDGFSQTDGIVVIAATNLPSSLDKALTRPGRFDRVIAVPLPDIRGRVQILKHYMSEVTADVDVDAMIIARGTPGFSGAELQNLINEAAIQASKLKADKITLEHVEWAKERMQMGNERRSMFIDEKEKLMTAYHEGGHTLVALYTKGAMPLHKVTCMPRSHSLGLTLMLPEADKHSMSFQEYKAIIDVSMGGRLAEELIYGTEAVTSGGSSDIRNATRTAAHMVKDFGFSEVVGPVYYDAGETSSISPAKILEIETAMTKLIREGEARARKLLVEKTDELHRLAHALVEYETLNVEEVKKVVKGEPIRKLEDVLAEVVRDEVPPVANLVPAGVLPPLKGDEPTS